jgi:hypothetical protein
MAAHVQPLPAIDPTLAERRRIIDSALGTTLAEGVSPGPEVLALSERFVAGEITMQELGTAVRAIDGI